MIEELREERKRFAAAIRKSLTGLLIPDLQDIVIQYWKPGVCSKPLKASEWAEMERGDFQTISASVHFDFSALPTRLAELGIKDDVDCVVQVVMDVATIVTQGHHLDFPVIWEDIEQTQTE